MEISRHSIATQIQIFSAALPLSPTTSPTTLHKNIPFKSQTTHFTPFLYPSFVTNSYCKNLRVTAGLARLGRLTIRPTSLRKKLDEKSEVPQTAQENLHPANHVLDSGSSDQSFGNSGPEQSSGEMGTTENASPFNNLKESKRFGESVLWNKLEGWVEQYRKDIEFWGIGWKAIFTVYQDSEGNVQRVLVDEDEILRRSGVNPLYFRVERVSEDLSEVDSKISHAKFLAREMESGKHVIPKNSSVAKFVLAGKHSGFIGKIRSISIPPNMLPRVSKMGIAVVFSFIFVWMMKKLFTLGGKDRELTRFEKEMLRRKIKSRMERDRLQEQNVEVLKNPSENPSEAVMESPQLEEDKDLTCEQDMDVKVQRIRMMARRVRKIEIGERSASEGNGSDGQTSNAIDRNIVEKPGNSVEGDELEIQASTEPPPSAINNADINGLKKEVQVTSMQNKSVDPENGEEG